MSRPLLIFCVAAIPVRFSTPAQTVPASYPTKPDPPPDLSQYMSLVQHKSALLRAVLRAGFSPPSHTKTQGSVGLAWLTYFRHQALRSLRIGRLRIGAQPATFFPPFRGVIFSGFKPTCWSFWRKGVLLPGRWFIAWRVDLPGCTVI